MFLNSDFVQVCFFIVIVSFIFFVTSFIFYLLVILFLFNYFAMFVVPYLLITLFPLYIIYIYIHIYIYIYIYIYIFPLCKTRSHVYITPPKHVCDELVKLNGVEFKGK